MISDDVARWLYRGGAPNSIARAINAGWAWVFSTGRVGRRAATLQVTGRRSGRPSTLPVVVCDMNGERYLVSMLGDDAQWVRNVRAADGHAVFIQGAPRDVRLIDVPVDERPPILRRYLELAPGARPHIPVDKSADLAAFADIAARYPVFRIEFTK
jgi:deazaflavin-dependent oxidoreductase (nitroreductase family)